MSRKLFRAGRLRVGVLLFSLTLMAPVMAWMTASQAQNRMTLWSAASAGVISREQLEQAITNADYLVIGEIHDNPEHHQVQARLLAHFADSHDGAVSVGFEQLTVDQQSLLDAFYQKADADPGTLGDALEWSQSGWPDYAIYEPLFAATLSRGLPIVPLMFTGAATRDIFSGGIEAALAKDALLRLRPDTLLSDGERKAVETEMQDAHCGKLPESMLPAMVNVQIARDAFMAYRIVQAAQRAVIITGNGHARRDRGMPRFLQRLRPDAQIVVVNLLEVPEGETGAFETQASRRVASSITDYAVFTPAHPRDDPCLALQ